MSFFEPPPPPPEPDEPEEFDEPEWMGPPWNVLGAAVPIRIVLARTEDVAIAVTDATAYPTGVEFKLVVRSRATDDDDFDPLDFHDTLVWRYRARRGREIPPEFLRFGVELADGSKATNLDAPFGDPEDEPTAPVLFEHGSGGGGGSWESEYWLWPLPPPGPLALVCEWPAKGVPLTRKEVEANVICEAAEQAETLWDEPGGRGRSWSRGGTMYLRGESKRDVGESHEDDERE